MKNKKNNAFSIIEIIVVMAILAILLLLAIPVFTDKLADAEQQQFDSIAQSINTVTVAELRNFDGRSLSYATYAPGSYVHQTIFDASGLNVLEHNLEILAINYNSPLTVDSVKNSVTLQADKINYVVVLPHNNQGNSANDITLGSNADIMLDFTYPVKVFAFSDDRKPQVYVNGENVTETYVN